MDKLVDLWAFSLIFAVLFTVMLLMNYFHFQFPFYFVEFLSSCKLDTLNLFCAEAIACVSFSQYNGTLRFQPMMSRRFYRKFKASWPNSHRPHPLPPVNVLECAIYVTTPINVLLSFYYGIFCYHSLSVFRIQDWFIVSIIFILLCSDFVVL